MDLFILCTNTACSRSSRTHDFSSSIILVPGVLILHGCLLKYTHLLYSAYNKKNILHKYEIAYDCLIEWRKPKDLHAHTHTQGILKQAWFKSEGFDFTRSRIFLKSSCAVRTKNVSSSRLSVALIGGLRELRGSSSSLVYSHVSRVNLITIPLASALHWVEMGHFS